MTDEKPRRDVTYREEAGGSLATCQCGWERWNPRRTDTERMARAHTCEKPLKKAHAPKKASAAAAWGSREGATWIDRI